MLSSGDNMNKENAMQEYDNACFETLEEALECSSTLLCLVTYGRGTGQVIRDSERSSVVDDEEVRAFFARLTVSDGDAVVRR